MAQQQTLNQPVHETTTVERTDERPMPRLSLRIEELEARLAPTVDPPSPLPGI